MHESMVWHTEIAFILDSKNHCRIYWQLAREYHMLTQVVWVSSPCR